ARQRGSRALPAQPPDVDDRATGRPPGRGEEPVAFSTPMELTTMIRPTVSPWILLRGLSPHRVACPYCGSRNVRLSRLRYGRLARRLGVVASRCRSCDGLFPLPRWRTRSLQRPAPDEQE